MYILAGCDTISYPFNNDKKHVLTLTLSRLEDLSIFGSMGEPEKERYLTGEMFNAVCRLFAILYVREYFEGSADDLHAHLYDLPPTEDALMQHVLRAFVQIIISKSSHLFQQNIPDQQNLTDMLQTTDSSLQWC